MAQFLSKLQHNTYEKGEFSDEKKRSLEETIEVIKAFPWDNERTLTDIQLTGPSVTIKDEQGNYLKIGLYFNSKFCLYYLDKGNHLYEYHAADLNDVIIIVTNFFIDQLDLSKFDKHSLNIGNQSHFITALFEYRENLLRFLMLNGVMIVFGVLFLIMDIIILVKGVSPGLFGGGVTVMGSIVFGLLLYKIFYNGIANRNNYLQISKGNDVFIYGRDKSEVATYYKKDIVNIVNYRPKGTRKPSSIETFEINFKNGTTINLSNMLIPGFDFRQKFADEFGNSNVEFVEVNKGILDMLDF